MKLPLAAAVNFKTPDVISAIVSFGDGKINDTYLVSSADGSFILQKLNASVFPCPDHIVENMRAVTGHLRLQNNGRDACESILQVPQLLETLGGLYSFQDEHGGFWRALRYIENVRTLSVVETQQQAKEVGSCLGWFHNRLSSLCPDTLHDTLPGFHHTPAYLADYDILIAENNPMINDAVLVCRQFIEERRGRASVLEDAKEKGLLAIRIIHGDPKVDNVLFDINSDQAAGIVDLDTVKPGLVQYDIGDCLRSCCNPAGEDPVELDSVHFDLDLCRAALSGYCKTAGMFLLPADYDFIYDAIRLIPFELGLRFLTDYLEGGIYFKTTDSGQNLRRAQVQFRLVESIEQNKIEIDEIIQSCRKKER